MADNKQIVMEIPQKIIEAQVKAAVISSLSGKNPHVFIGALVEQVLKAQEPGSYGRRTILDATIAKMIEEVSRQFIGQWIEEARPLIKAELDKRMRRNPKQFASDVADKVVDAMKGSMYINIRIGEARD